ncbi:MAG: hypothetical protein V4555_07685 [Acidobacteriota bacterium]
MSTEKDSTNRPADVTSSSRPAQLFSYIGRIHEERFHDADRAATSVPVAGAALPSAPAWLVSRMFPESALETDVLPSKTMKRNLAAEKRK